MFAERVDSDLESVGDKGVASRFRRRLVTIDALRP